MSDSSLTQNDPEVSSLISAEEERQQDKLNMIPSENFASKAVREAVGSVLTNKYSEGNIGKRYYEGNQYIDQLESLTIERAKKFFNVPEDWHANVQALSGSSANLAAFLAVLNKEDMIMSMYLPDGGHLSHGWSYNPSSKPDPNEMVYYEGMKEVHVVSKLFDILQYKTDPKTQLLDYDKLEEIAKEHKPKILVTGGTAYPREIDYKRMKAIADSVGAMYLADIAHEAGLIGAGVLESPVGIADIVTMTTHKTLRAARGAIILAHEDIIKKVNRAVLPGLQGGPHNHNIGGICVGLGEALEPEFKDYAQQVVKNAKHLATQLQKFDFKLVSGGTDKHLILINMINKGILGKYSARALDYAGIVANMNTMPQETKSPANPSALRLGTPLVTTRGMKEKEMEQIAKWIHKVIEISQEFKHLEFEEFETKISENSQIEKLANEVKAFCNKFPLNI